jgi:hypothetical protein
LELYDVSKSLKWLFLVQYDESEALLWSNSNTRADSLINMTGLLDRKSSSQCEGCLAISCSKLIIIIPYCYKLPTLLNNVLIETVGDNTHKDEQQRETKKE